MKCVAPTCSAQATKFYSYIGGKKQLWHRSEDCYKYLAITPPKQFYTEQEYIALALEDKL